MAAYEWQAQAQGALDGRLIPLLSGLSREEWTAIAESEVDMSALAAEAAHTLEKQDR